MKNFINKLDSHTREVLSGTVIAFSLRGLGAGLAFVLNVVIGRLLGAEGAGLYFLALSITSILAVVSKFGLDNSLLRFIAEGKANGDWGRIKGVFASGMKIAGLASLGLSLLIVLTAPLVADSLFSEPDLLSPLRWMSPAICTFVLMTLLAESLKGLKSIGLSMLVSGVIYPAVALVLIYPLVSLMGTSGAAVAYVLGTCVAALVGAVAWCHITKSKDTATSFDPTTLWASCRPLWVMSIINRAVMPWAPLFLLGIWGTVEDVGIFGAATRVAMLVSFFLVAVNTAIAPKFSELYSRRDFDALGTLTQKFALLTVLATSPIFLILILAGDWVMGLFGDEFTSGGTALALLAVGQAINALTGSVGNLLMMTGHENDIRNASLFGLLIMLGFSFLMIPGFGLIGAAIASASAMAGSNLFSVMVVRIRLGIFALPFRRTK